MKPIAVIGGSGLSELGGLKAMRREVMRTPYGEPSAPITRGELAGREVIFLPRHGAEHAIAPHEINYRANLWALKQAGATYVIAVNAVGAIRDGLVVGQLVFPDQIIDYTYGRAHTFFSGGAQPLKHADFTEPYCERLRGLFIAAAAQAGLRAAAEGTYAATQGPRFESAAEIRRCARDGADIVGMTGMPEGGLARELELCYASIAVVVNPAAGKVKGAISLEEIGANLHRGMAQVCRLLEVVMPMIPEE